MEERQWGALSHKNVILSDVFNPKSVIYIRQTGPCMMTEAPSVNVVIVILVKCNNGRLRFSKARPEEGKER